MSEVGQSIPFGTLFEIHPSDDESERSTSPIPIQLYPRSQWAEDLAALYPGFADDDPPSPPENNIYDRVQYDSDGNYHAYSD